MVFWSSRRNWGSGVLRPEEIFRGLRDPLQGMVTKLPFGPPNGAEYGLPVWFFLKLSKSLLACWPVLILFEDAAAGTSFEACLELRFFDAVDLRRRSLTIWLDAVKKNSSDFE